MTIHYFPVIKKMTKNGPAIHFLNLTTYGHLELQLQESLQIPQMIVQTVKTKIGGWSSETNDPKEQLSALIKAMELCLAQPDKIKLNENAHDTDWALAMEDSVEKLKKFIQHPKFTVEPISPRADLNKPSTMYVIYFPDFDTYFANIRGGLMVEHLLQAQFFSSKEKAEARGKTGANWFSNHYEIIPVDIQARPAVHIVKSNKPTIRDKILGNISATFARIAPEIKTLQIGSTIIPLSTPPENTHQMTKT